MSVVANKKAIGVAAAGLALSLLAATGGAWAQRAAVEGRSSSSQKAPAASDQTAEQVYKNIQVLNGLPASDLTSMIIEM